MAKKNTKKFKIKRKKVEMRDFYDQDVDIISFFWGKKVEHSRELNVHVVIDFDKKDNIVGIDIYDFLEAIRKSDKEIEKMFKEQSIFKKNDKKQKNGSKKVA